VWKHPAFVEEAEWRLVSEQRLERAVQFRAGRTAIIPYVEIPLNDMEETQISNMTAVLNQIYVGPCPEPELAVASAHAFAGGARNELSAVHAILDTISALVAHE
jgi:hypothetical protein